MRATVGRSYQRWRCPVLWFLIVFVQVNRVRGSTLVLEKTSWGKGQEYITLLVDMAEEPTLPPPFLLIVLSDCLAQHRPPTQRAYL